MLDCTGNALFLPDDSSKTTELIRHLIRVEKRFVTRPSPDRIKTGKITYYLQTGTVVVPKIAAFRGAGHNKLLEVLARFYPKNGQIKKIDYAIQV